jgi:hypothetical protein
MPAAIFLACAILAVAFFLYALAQFVREERRARNLPQTHSRMRGRGSAF